MASCAQSASLVAPRHLPLQVGGADCVVAFLLPTISLFCSTNGSPMPVQSRHVLAESLSDWSACFTCSTRGSTFAWLVALHSIFVHHGFVSTWANLLCCPCRVPLWHHYCSTHHMVTLHAAQPPRQHHSGTQQHTRGPQHHHCCAHHMVALHAAQPPRQHHSSTRQHPSGPWYHPTAHMPCLPLWGHGQRVEHSLWPAVPSLPVLWPHSTSHFRWVVLTALLLSLCLQ